MKYRFLILVLIAFIHLTSDSSAQVREVKFNTIDSLLKQSPEAPIVMNFWATWCKPCIQELPFFEELYKNYSASGVKVVMVSLDFKRELETRVKPFVQKKQYGF